MLEILTSISKNSFEERIVAKMGNGEPRYNARFYDHEWSNKPVDQITWEYSVRAHDKSGLLALYDSTNPKLRTNIIFLEMSPQDETKATSIQAWIGNPNDSTKYYSLIYKGEGNTARHLALHSITRMRRYQSGSNGGDKRWNNDGLQSTFILEELFEEIKECTGTMRDYRNTDWYGLFSFYSNPENITKSNYEAIMKNPIYPF